MALTLNNIPYGPHERNVFDLYKASDEVTPLLFYIHGGGWTGGEKEKHFDKLREVFLPEGISMSSLNYRLAPENPLPAPVHDAALGLQFIRHKADEYKIDKTKIG
ncbi:MAG: alpha/beta hydrolase, partial [Planctomycetota bacterium]